MKSLYLEASIESSKVITNHYSTSFSLGIKSLSKRIHAPIYAIYGFVRLADEIVDTFHGKDKATLLQEFVSATNQAIQRKISLNPVLESFQWVVNHYHIEQELIDAFIKSMEFDLSKKTYDQKGFETYVYGSAEVVGLMCLRIFCERNEEQYQQLKTPAKRLGAAFQKINFLRDLKSDVEERGRSYFPNLDPSDFTDEKKKAIEADIEADFKAGYQGIKDLPSCAKFGVYTAYIYYYALFKKIQKIKAERIMQERIRIPDFQKYLLLSRSLFLYNLGVV